MKRAHKIILIAAGLAIAISAVYVQVRTFEFITFDDNIYVTKNEQVKQGLTLENLIWSFNPKAADRNYWHPLSWLSHMLDVQLFGLNPGAHHLMNVFFHMLNTTLLFLCLHLMTGAVWKSAFVAALFALHPINVDSVAWIAERKNLLSTTFWMLTLLTYISYARKPGIVRYLLVGFTLTLGLLAKPMLVTLPCVLLLLDFWPLGRLNFGQTLPPQGKKARFQTAGRFRLTAEKLPLLALSLMAIVMALISLKHSRQICDSSTLPPLFLRLENALISYLEYIWKLIRPLDLAFFYPFPKTIPVWEIFFAGFFLITISGFCLIRFRKSPYLIVGWFWFLGTLVPVIGLIQGGLWPALADRWAYVPAIGIFMMIAWGIPEISRRFTLKPTPMIAAAIMVLCACGALTFRQAGHWKTSENLYTHALKVNANNYVAHNNIGSLFQASGDIKKAAAKYRAAIAAKPDYAFAHFNLGVAMNKLGKKREAVLCFTNALRISPHYGHVHEKMADLRLDLGDYSSAIDHYVHAIRVNPFNPHLHFKLAQALMATGRMDAALFHFQKALTINPNFSEARLNLANAYYGQGKLDAAILEYNRILEKNPTMAEAHANLGNALRGKEQTKEAIGHYLRAIDLNPDIPENFNNLGVAYIALGDIPAAAECFQNALALRPDYANARNNLARALTMINLQYTGN